MIITSTTSGPTFKAGAETTQAGRLFDPSRSEYANGASTSWPRFKDAVSSCLHAEAGSRCYS